MAVPKNIFREHLEKAINKIDEEGIPTDANSQYYDVIFNGKIYPPKLIVSYANIFANGEVLDRTKFEGGIGTECFKLLERNGFIIQEKKTQNTERRYWIEKTIVNGRLDRMEGDRALGKALWSPQKSKNGADVYKNMRLVNKGDVIFHFIDNKVFSGVSIVKEKAVETNGLEGTEWDGPAYLISLEKYTQLVSPIRREDLLVEGKRSELLRISDSSEVFYNKKLDLRQGAYLTPCSIDLLILISSVYYSITLENLPHIGNITERKKVTSNSLSTMHIPMKSLLYFLSIKTKPFVILAGISGTGKSRLVRTLAYQFNNIITDKEVEKNPPTNFQLIKVKPNWHDSSELLGYESRISGKDRFVATDFLRFIVKAWQHPETPFFLCLDEMNLAPVEQYFAEYLSAIETRRLVNGRIKTDSLVSGSLITKYAEKSKGVDYSYELWNELELSDVEIQKEVKENGLGLPSNLIVMGTVNMDETTHSFSRKVLDRAMTIEMNDINLSDGLGADADDWNYLEEPLQKVLVLSEKTQGAEVFAELSTTGEEIISYLDIINTKLEGSPFKIAYRVRDEFLLYAFNYSLLETKPEDWKKSVLDEMTLMKILPRIEGDEDKTKLLDDLIILFQENNLPKSLNKATEMANSRRLSHYTSFWS
jgi:5-methylcytosine-specific restriction protein B